MGIVHSGAADTTEFSSRARVAFALSGETDGGLSFGAGFRADNASGANEGTAGSVFISGAFGKLEMGDVVGAAEGAVGDLPEIGYTDIASNDVTFIAGDSFNGTAPAVLYTYSAGSLTVMLGASDGAGEDAQELSVGAKYAMGDYAFSAGYETVEDGFFGAGTSATHLVVGAEGTFSGVTLKAIYGQGGDVIDGFEQWGLGATYAMDALSVSAMYKVDNFTGSDVASYGVGAAYDLGGGAKVVGGIADNDAAGSSASYDVGVTFSF